MIKLRKLLIMCIVIIVLLISWLIIYPIIGTGISYLNSREVLYHDRNIFIERDFLDKENYNSAIYSSGVIADRFFPIYDEIKFKYDEINFYIYSGHRNLTHTGVTFSLDLIFDNENEYDEAKNTVLNYYNFLKLEDISPEYSGPHKPQVIFEIDNFVCKIVNEGDYTKYPSYFGMICYNDKEKVLRYLFFRELESPEYVQSVEYIKKCSNCPWTFSND